jgi:hypothetical protein
VDRSLKVGSHKIMGRLSLDKTMASGEDDN